MDNKFPMSKELLNDLKSIIEQGKQQAITQVNSRMTIVFWQVGKRINEDILQNKRAEYGKQIITSLSEQLIKQYGKSFQTRNLRRMLQFAVVFPDITIVSPLVSQLSWTHFTILISLKNQEARMFYANKAVEGSWSKRELSNQIERKSFERSEIADSQLPTSNQEGKKIFKDPYFLDFLDLKEYPPSQGHLV